MARLRGTQEADQRAQQVAGVDGSAAEHLDEVAVGRRAGHGRRRLEPERGEPLAEQRRELLGVDIGEIGGRGEIWHLDVPGPPRELLQPEVPEAPGDDQDDRERDQNPGAARGRGTEDRLDEAAEADVVPMTYDVREQRQHPDGDHETDGEAGDQPPAARMAHRLGLAPPPRHHPGRALTEPVQRHLI